MQINTKQHNSKGQYNADYPYRILMIGGFVSGKANALLNIKNNQTDIDKKYLYARDPYGAKYQFSINKRESIELKHFNDPKFYIEYSNDMQNFYKNIEEYNIWKT